MPMPMQGGAPGAAPAADSPVEESQEAAAPQKGGAAEFIISLDGGLTKLMAIMEQSKVPPESLQAMQAALDSFRAAVEGLSGGSPQPSGGQEPADMGSSTMEQGGAKGAVPAY